MKKVKIGSAEFDFNWSKIKTRETFCDAMDAYLATASTIDAEYEGSAREQRDRLKQYKSMCVEIYAFIDKLFGVGAAESALGGEFDIEACVDAFAEIKASVDEQEVGTMQRMSGANRESKTE